LFAVDHLSDEFCQARFSSKGDVMKLANFCKLFFLVAVLVVGASARAADNLEARLKVMGHRNWVVIADMAYPQQSNPAIDTVYMGGSQVAAVKHVLKLIDAAPHVRPVVYTDAELPAVDKSDAPGIDAYRDELKAVLAKYPVKSLPHEQIIGRLDESARLFKVLILKTDMTLPYTSVFVELECGYWSDAAEKRLRKAIGTE
jgi:L-fucose mutarotase/ribose pyranase (RbsD/FucU family)